MTQPDISKKVHTSYLLRAKQGRYTGVVPPFSYMKDPDQKGHLIIDEETAWIVRKIFGYAMENRGSGYIVRRLEKEKIACPAWWFRKRGLRNKTTKQEKKDPVNGKYLWDFSVIERMLENPVYYGAICSQKMDYRFKVGNIRKKDASEWIIVEDMHEPIIDRETFEIVRGKIKKRQHPRKSGGDNVFAGLIKCGECGRGLNIRYTNSKHPRYVFVCKTYTLFGPRHCSQHGISYDVLYEIMLERIRHLAAKTLKDDAGTREKVEGLLAGMSASDSGTNELEKEKLLERMKDLERLVTRLYDDLVKEKISAENFESVLASTQKEQEELKLCLKQLGELEQPEKSASYSEAQWKELIGKYADIKELDRETLNRLVRSIIVHETVDGKKRSFRIEIHSNCKKVTEVAEGGDFAIPARIYWPVTRPSKHS